MKKVSTLVITQKTSPPIAILKAIEAATILSPTFVEAKSPSDIQRVLAENDPRLIILDGEYGLTDRERWAELSKLPESELRIRLIEGGKDLPESLSILRYAHALKNNGTVLAIFIDNPSRHVVGELGRIGSTFVGENLNSITPLKSSLFQIVQGVKTTTVGIRDFAKSFLNEGR